MLREEIAGLFSESEAGTLDDFDAGILIQRKVPR